MHEHKHYGAYLTNMLCSSAIETPRHISNIMHSYKQINKQNLFTTHNKYIKVSHHTYYNFNSYLLSIQCWHFSLC